MKTIKRVLLEPETVRRMAEPDFDKPRPEYCDDVLILYATSEPTDFSPLIQSAIELSPQLSTRGPNPPDVRSFGNLALWYPSTITLNIFLIKTITKVVEAVSKYHPLECHQQR